MIPRAIHQIHLGEPASEKLQNWMRGVQEKNPGWNYQLWDEKALGEEGFDIERSLEDLGSWAAVSNAIRLLLLNRFGGYYLDTDFEALGPLDKFPERGAVAALQDTDRICNAFMGAPPAHPWIRWQIKHFADYDQRDPASGVYLATAAPREGLTLVKSHLVYPYSYDASPEKQVAHPDSIVVHRWQKSWGPPCSTS